MVRTLNRSSDPIAKLFLSLFNRFHSFMQFLKYLLTVWEPNIYLLLSALVFSGFDSSAREQRQKSSLTLRKSQETKTGVFCLDTCRSVGLLLQTFIHWAILIQVYVNVSVKEEYRGFVRIKTNRKSVSTPSWSVPSCGTHLQLWSWCCSPKVSSRELLWQCACRRSTRVSLSLIFRTRSWRWILMMTCRVLPARESRARAKPLRSSFPICTRTYVEKPTIGASACEVCVCLRANHVIQQG